jgi:exonuclease III
MRVMSWNLNARRKCVPLQAEAICRLQPDVACFQEATIDSWEDLVPMLREAGLVHALSGPETLAGGSVSSINRWVAVASRWPLEPQEACFPVPELVVCARVLRPSAPVDLVAVHVPTRSRDAWLKVEVQEAIAARLGASDLPQVLCGDFNSPRAETESGEVVAFIGPRGGRALAAELALVVGPATHGMVDVYRAVNGWRADDRSWFWKRYGETGGYRLDHIFASASLEPEACWYAHELRLSGLSDHSPIIADFRRAP